MTAEDLLLKVAVAEGVLLFLLLGWTFFTAHRRQRWESASDRVLAEGRSVLTRALLGEATTDEDRARLESLSRRRKARLLVQVAPSLQGASRDAVKRVARELGIVDWAEGLCGSPWWWRRLRGARLLTALGGGGDSVPRLLGDSAPPVRAQAIEWTAANPELGGPDLVLPHLTDPDPICRFAAKDALLRLGSASIPAVTRYLDSGPAEGRGDALEIAVGTPDPAYVGPALNLIEDPEPRIRRGVARLLAAVGGEEAVDALWSLLEDSDPGVRAEACRGLGRLDHWPASTALGARLRDPAWEVRRAAGEALGRMGSPGRLILTRARTDEDPFAADMARLVLETPGRPTLALENVE